MISIRDRVKKQLESASAVEVADANITLTAKRFIPIIKSIAGASADIDIVPEGTMHTMNFGLKLTRLYVKGLSRSAGRTLSGKINKYRGKGSKKEPITVGKYSVEISGSKLSQQSDDVEVTIALEPIKEKASVEVAAVSTKKMAAKIAAISSNMKLTEKQWDSIDKAVRAELFSKERAAVEVANEAAYIKKKQSAESIAKRIASGKLVWGDDKNDPWLSEPKVKAKMKKMVGKDKVVTLKGDNENHFWVAYANDPKDILGAVYLDGDVWYGFMGSVTGSYVGKYSTKDIAAAAVSLDATG